MGIECERFVIFKRHILRVFSDNLCLEFLFPVSAITLKIMVFPVFFYFAKEKKWNFSKIIKKFYPKNISKPIWELNTCT